MRRESSAQQKTWWKEVVFYQIYPLSFYDANDDGIGDIPGIITKLPYLKDLGIGAIWISPLYDSPMVDNGYDISNYDAINPRFGTMDDFDQLIKHAHDLGIKIMMDLVINHTSDQHTWFQKSRHSRDNAHSDYYIWHAGKDGHEPNNWAADCGGSAWTWDETRRQYYLHLFSKNQPDLNWHSPAIKKEIFAMMRRWLARGVDGFRADMGNFLFKADGFPDAIRHDGDTRTFVHGEHLYANQPGIHALWREIRRDVLAPYNAVVLGEMYFLTPKEGLNYVGTHRSEIDMLYQYHIMDARGDWTRVKKAVREWHTAFLGKGWNTIGFSNHDSPRSVSIYGDSIYNHEKSAKLIMTFLLTAPGTPFFLQGEEIGMTNKSIHDARELTDIKMRGAYSERIAQGHDPADILTDLSWWNRDNARTPMQWSNNPHGGFSTVVPWLAINPNYTRINVQEQSNNPYSIWHYTKSVIHLRNTHKTLVYGKFTPLFPDDWTVYGYTRSDGDATFIIIFNFASTDNHIGTPTILKNHNAHLVIANYEVTSDPHDILFLRPWETRIYRTKKHGER